MATQSVSALTRPGGGFAMVAIDQREPLRLMLAGDTEPEADGGVPAWVRARVADEELTEFKVAATAALSPYASGILIDPAFGFDQVVEAGAVHGSCGLIAACDRFSSGNGELVADAEFDGSLDLAALRAAGAVAGKLLVIWRPDESAERRIAMVERFVASCREAGLLSIIEPVSRSPHVGGSWDWDAGVLAAAEELGRRGQDLYKAEVPLKGAAPDDDVRLACADLGSRIDSPWVVLSSGVSPDNFPRAVALACREGASGFLAGRAVWRSSLGAEDRLDALRTDAVDRLRTLVEVVDAEVGG